MPVLLIPADSKVGSLGDRQLQVYGGVTDRICSPTGEVADLVVRGEVPKELDGVFYRVSLKKAARSRLHAYLSDRDERHLDAGYDRSLGRTAPKGDTSATTHRDL